MLGGSNSRQPCKFANKMTDVMTATDALLKGFARFKEDAQEVRNGTECGIGVKHYNDIKKHDQIECFEKIQVTRTL